MASTPKANARPEIYLRFSLGGQKLPHEGVAFRRFEFKGMLNGGYIIKAQLFDTHSNLLNKLVELGYFRESRVHPVEVTFQIKWHKEAKYPDEATRPKQIAYLVSLHVTGSGPDVAYLEFIAVDPPSWHLNTGDASGKVYTGSVSDVIRYVVEDYAPGIELIIGETTDSKENKWGMMRMDPKTFIGSLLDWSSSITTQKTQWLVIPHGRYKELTIVEQASLTSRDRAYYRYHKNDAHDTVRSYEMIADNAMSVSATKLITSGLSSVSGQYLDQIMDQPERVVFAKDGTTPNKQIARVRPEQSYEKVPDGRPPDTEVAGWTHVSAVPEPSGGELGRRYEEWIDGRPRGLYLNMTNLLFRTKFKVVGHGVWSDCRGLGVDTFFVKWLSADGSDYFMTGNWLAYGFHHVVTRKFWYTDLYGARFDHDANARKVGAGG